MAISTHLITGQNTDQNQKKNISLTIKNVPEKETGISFRCYDNLWGNQENVKKNEKNEIIITKEVNHNDLLMLNMQAFTGSFNIYLEKGDALTISINNQKAVIEGETRETKKKS